MAEIKGIGTEALVCIIV